MAADHECCVCCESYNKTSRKKAQCAHCDTACCSACLAKYLLGLPGDAHCMNPQCKKAFDGEFLSLYLSKTWMLTKYKEHRERVLLEREMALLPESQHILANYRHAQGLEASLLDLEDSKRQLHRQLFALNARAAPIRNELDMLRRTNYAQRVGGDRGVEQRRQFVRACPVEGCRGFLSTAWKCGTCESWVCKDCGEPKMDQRDQEHRCDPDVAASHAMLQRDSRPCPQCASMIFKIDGCFAPDTPVRLWSGGVKMSQDIAAGDVLIGDDHEPRTVQATCSGEDQLFAVRQLAGMAYTVNSKHALVFRFGPEGVARDDDGRWCVTWMDRVTGYVRTAAHPSWTSAMASFDALGLDPCIEMMASSYVALPPEVAGACVAVRKLPGGEDLATRFDVTPVGPGAYHGWSLDGNKRFLLEDGTVARNCDQMWCTQCHVAFSWRTGAVVTNGVIHNPHWYEWMRRTRGEVPRTGGDLPCGGLPGLYELDGALRRRREVTPEQAQTLRTLHRVLRHVHATDLPRLRGEAQAGNDRNMDLRLQYLLNQVDQDAWRKKLQQREKKRERSFAVLQVYDMFAAVATDVFRALVTGDVSAAAAGDQLAQLQRFANESLDAIAKRFNMCVKRLRGQ
jgi:hypothetical protein